MNQSKLISITGALENEFTNGCANGERIFSTAIFISIL